MSQRGGSFLTFDRKPPQVWVTSSSPHPPERTLLYWREDGFDVHYLPYDRTDKDAYLRTIHSLDNGMGLTETYAIVCYGEAATQILKVATKPMHKCSAIIAYYPTHLPDPNHKYPSMLNVTVHVAMLSQKCPPPEQCAWKCYQYEHCAVGFADPTSPNYSEGDANLAGSRSLIAIHRGAKMDVDIEPVADEAWKGKYEIEDPERGSMAVVSRMTQNAPHVTLLPTLEGGVGRKKLQEFYQDIFIPSLVEDFEIRLVSRTIGHDRVVDEMIISFTHTDDMDWILPGVPPTDKYVEIGVVSIVAVRGGKLVSEHMYWDQASVLMQVGLLDPKAVPKKMKDEGLKRLPVVGAEATKQLVEPRHGAYNGLLRMHGLLDGLQELNAVNGS
ncbi:NTF2-like protein [Westerdykella ornata]|uniref:NTF2-like protein n=1 Tax=Westerdykella ornata TaxID=318751 RepID=A0A6A6JEW0_WESOR|nr:NTF2-like protein [Westerdykella ornata]KAF2274774.1 NTF2-like protein [Westerdykella ornata]